MNSKIYPKISMTSLTDSYHSLTDSYHLPLLRQMISFEEKKILTLISQSPASIHHGEYFYSISSNKDLYFIYSYNLKSSIFDLNPEFEEFIIFFESVISMDPLPSDEAINRLENLELRQFILFNLDIIKWIHTLHFTRIKNSWTWWDYFQNISKRSSSVRVLDSIYH